MQIHSRRTHLTPNDDKVSHHNIKKPPLPDYTPIHSDEDLNDVIEKITELQKLIDIEEQHIAAYFEMRRHRVGDKEFVDAPDEH